MSGAILTHSRNFIKNGVLYTIKKNIVYFMEILSFIIAKRSLLIKIKIIDRVQIKE